MNQSPDNLPPESSRRRAKGILSVACLCGTLMAAGVFTAHYFQVPGMNLREGFWGTHFLDSFMYAAQPPVWLGMLVITGFYFMYGFLGIILIGVLSSFRLSE